MLVSYRDRKFCVTLFMASKHWSRKLLESTRFAEQRTMVKESFRVERVHDNGYLFREKFMTPTFSVACVEHELRGNNGRP